MTSGQEVNFRGGFQTVNEALGERVIGVSDVADRSRKVRTQVRILIYMV